MKNFKKDIKFKKIKNFLSKKEVQIYNEYFLIKHKNNTEEFDFVQNNNGDTFFYADPLTESLLMHKKKIIEKETNLSLYPTYSFFRMYTMFSDLKKHSDRPSW